MKYYRHIILLFLLPIFGCVIYPKIEAKKFDDFKSDYLKTFSAFDQEVESLRQIGSEDWIYTSKYRLQHQLKKTRLAYKRVEFVFDYYETTFNYLHINGGPLPKPHHEISEIDFLAPNGLQTLDELIYSDEIYSNRTQIDSLTHELKKAVKLITTTHQQLSITPRQLIESIRSGLIRNFTLGLTGFDTPGSVNGIEETKVSFVAMSEAFQYLQSTTTDSSKVYFRNIEDRFRSSISYLQENADFDGFDRLEFLMMFVNPLYHDLRQFQKSAGIATSSYKTHAHNYETDNLFDEDFLNTDFYSEFSYNPLHNKSAIHLGKLLFHDPILSNNLKMSCATCHDPKKAFTDNLAKSKTNKPGVTTQRNAPTLIDVGYSSRYFWDMREYDLEKQVAHVINDTNEFNIGFPKIIKRLNQSSTYRALFDEAYKGISKKDINSRSISNAIAAYVNTLKSFDSPFDRYVRRETDDYPREAKRGFNLFMGKAACGTCHFAPVFNGSVPPYYMEAESEVLGVTVGFDSLHPEMDQDLGRFANGLKREAFAHYKHSIKTVTVRNVELTGPYMHNGSFDRLEDVMSFYNLGGGSGMGLQIENQTLSSERLNLSATEQSDIIVFLNTLTDTTGLTRPVTALPLFENNPQWNNRLR